MNILFKKKKCAMAIFVIPLMAIYLLIILIPLIKSVYYGFTEWDGVNMAVFIGTDNYQRLFQSRDLGISIRNSVIFSIVLTIYQVGLGTLFAYFFSNFELRCRTFFKNVYFFPVLLSVSVVGQLFISIYHGDFGLINQISESLGSSWSQNWLNEPVKGVVAIALAEGWKGMGSHMLIIYTAMKNIPKVYTEAATIDGASKSQQFLHIIFPLAMPTIKVCIILCITYGFRVFEMVYLMTGGGPGNYSKTLTIMMYDALFKLQKYGYGSAVSVVIVVICVGVLLLVNKLTARFDEQY